MDDFSLHRFFRNESTISEREMVIQWLLQPKNDFLVLNWMKENWNLIDQSDDQDANIDPDIKKIWSKIHQKINETPELLSEVPIVNLNNRPQFNHKGKNFFYLVAAFIAIIIGVTYFFFINKPYSKTQSKDAIVKSSKVNDISAPHTSKAVLTLSDGKKIDLDSAGNGLLAIQNEVIISKNEKGEIIYNSPSAVSAISYNTLSLPKGSKPIRLSLADGSLVWLNASSSITYPNYFKDSERKVSITGEVYFEVAKNAQKPFYVNYNDLFVKVLGTHFNVNAYPTNQNTIVSLLEGSIQVLKNGDSKMIKPGQQAIVSKNLIGIQDVSEIEEIIAWKNGYFFFSGTNLKEIMQQVERSYNVDVEFKDEIPYQFVAKISKDVNLSEFLERLELTNLVHFKIIGNKIIVSK